MNQDDSGISVADIMNNDTDKLSFDQLKTIIQCNKPELDLEDYDYDTLEKLFILVAWENQVENIDTKQYSIMRLKTYFYL